ncbi:MAG: DUF1080 domain-containing protein [Terriglobales bacterium]|jgi:hypothetical protein
MPRHLQTLFCAALFVAVLSSAHATFAKGPRNLTGSAPDAATAKPFLGRWDLTLKDAGHEYPSWLEIRLEDGKLAAQMVGRWGNARPLPKVEISDGEVIFVSPKEEEDLPADMVFTGKLNGNTLSGSVTGPKEGPWTWSGVRAPLLQTKGTPKWGKPVSLFNGKDLTGWKMSDPNPATVWKVENGTLVSPGHGPEIINEQKFQDFKLHIEFNCAPNANSGVYLRGRYEVQIEDDSIKEPPSHHTGGVYGFLAPSPEMPRKPGEWQTFDITLIGRTITVLQNGTTIIDHQEIPGITGGALDSHEELPGPIYLQGSENSHVAFRNIVITPARE